MPKRLIIPDGAQQLVSDSAEALLRYWRDIIDGGIPNELYLQAHQENIKECAEEYAIGYPTFEAALIQTFCLTIINMANEGMLEDNEEEDDEY